MFHIHKLHAVELLSPKGKNFFVLCQCFCSFYCTLFSRKVNNRKLHNVLGSMERVSVKISTADGGKTIERDCYLIEWDSGKVKVVRLSSTGGDARRLSWFPFSCRPHKSQTVKEGKKKSCDKVNFENLFSNDKRRLQKRRWTICGIFLRFRFWCHGIWQPFNKRTVGRDLGATFLTLKHQRISRHQLFRLRWRECRALTSENYRYTCTLTGCFQRWILKRIWL